MNISSINGYSLNNLGSINIILGKNGAGKSTLLRLVEQGISTNTQLYGKTKYITPERGGALVYAAGIEENMFRDENWMPSQRRKNQAVNFRQQSVSQYRKLETLVLREFESDQSKSKFNPYIEKINSLLDNIEIRREGLTFKIYKKDSGEELKSEEISSGESELISLGIECLIFSKECISDRENVLFLDEPDVHLHPDLQARLINFLVNLVEENKFKVIIATHSTAILGALEVYSDTNLSFMVFSQTELNFEKISDVYKKILPVFGAHPLSNVFNETPILLVEGEDDERIWQQAVRSSSPKIKIYPCSVDSISKLNEYEQKTAEIISAVYNNAKGYSLRDRDDSTEEIADSPPIIRMKFSCRSAENLLLTDDVLRKLNISWDELKTKVTEWINKNPDHVHYQDMISFKDSNFDRKQHNLKQIRNDLMGIVGSEKPWEVVVGQSIAELSWNTETNFVENGSLIDYLGEKVIKNLLPEAT